MVSLQDRNVCSQTVGITGRYMVGESRYVTSLQFNKQIEFNMFLKNVVKFLCQYSNHGLTRDRHRETFYKRIKTFI